MQSTKIFQVFYQDYLKVRPVNFVRELFQGCILSCKLNLMHAAVEPASYPEVATILLYRKDELLIIQKAIVHAMH